MLFSMKNFSEKFHGLFGFGWKNQEHTVTGKFAISKGSMTCPLLIGLSLLSIKDNQNIKKSDGDL